MWLLRPAHKHIGQVTLSEHLDGRLRGRLLERVERQLEECDACRQELADLQATVAMTRQMPMEAPRRSFVMSAPPMESTRARPNLALRAPNWVYAGAASVAALALAITVSVDATGGLSSDPLRRDVETTAVATAATSMQVTGFPTIESVSRSGEATGSGEPEAAPQSLAAAAPATATPGPTVQEDSAVGGAADIAAAGAGVAPPAPASQDDVVTVIESAVAPEISGEDGDASNLTDQRAKALTIEEPAEAPAPVPEPAEPDLFDAGSDGQTSVWWRVLEAGAGALALVFLAALVLRWRAGRPSL